MASSRNAIARDSITYYEVEPKGALAALLVGGRTRVGSGGPAYHTDTAEEDLVAVPVAADDSKEGHSRLLWAALGLAAVILLSVVGVIVLLATEQAPAVAPPVPEVTTTTATTTASTLPEGAAAIIPPTTESTVPSKTGPTVYTHPLTNPVRIVIPAISTAADIIPVGVAKEGVMETPPARKAGWYKLGPVPGAPGPAVIIAHSFFNHERDVFYNLKRLQPGDEIQVYDGSGDVAVFVVDSKEEILKSELPTERIWNETSESVIRLVTCGGTFDPETRHFLSNVIVYGHLVR